MTDKEAFDLIAAHAVSGAVGHKFASPLGALLPGGGMRSAAWRCSACKVTRQFDAPVRPPAPCGCGGVFFEKVARVGH